MGAAVVSADTTAREHLVHLTNQLRLAIAAQNAAEDRVKDAMSATEMHRLASLAEEAAMRLDRIRSAHQVALADVVLGGGA